MLTFCLEEYICEINFFMHRTLLDRWINFSMQWKTIESLQKHRPTMSVSVRVKNVFRFFPNIKGCDIVHLTLIVLSLRERNLAQVHFFALPKLRRCEGIWQTFASLAYRRFVQNHRKVTSVTDWKHSPAVEIRLKATEFGKCGSANSFRKSRPNSHFSTEIEKSQSLFELQRNN